MTETHTHTHLTDEDLHCVFQVVERLESDLGVKVQEVNFPGFQYGFQIWNTYMSLPDEEGRVGPPGLLVAFCVLSCGHTVKQNI